MIDANKTVANIFTRRKQPPDVVLPMDKNEIKLVKAANLLDMNF